ncbi:hypothetical protein EON65_29900 [archaeon]|nr:MAG: hypothetical protein EON65_29900 [archaeon]
MSGLHNLTAKEIDRVNRGLAPWESMSFACGGWLQFYMFGVAKALQVNNMDKGVKYLGCSAGSLAAVGLVIDGDFDAAVKFCKEYCIPKAYGEINGLFKLSEYVSMCMELCIMPKLKEIPPDTLHVAVTRLPFLQAERVTDHKNVEELVLTLLASCAAFPFAPIVNRNNGWYIDGGLSDFQPVLDDETITVSPFYFTGCHIKPSRYIPLWWTFLPPKSGETVDWIYNLGYEDCVHFLKSKGLPVRSDGSPKLSDNNGHPYNEPGRVR